MNLSLQRSPGFVAGDRRCSGRAGRAAGGFNGAPASWPGIASGIVHVDRGDGASTEPRLRGRGSRFTGERSERASSLQRSPGFVAGDRSTGTHRSTQQQCFNGAPASWPGIGRRRCWPGTTPRPLQRSPGFVAGDRVPVDQWVMVLDGLQRSPGFVAGDRQPPLISTPSSSSLQRSPGFVAGDRRRG